MKMFSIYFLLVISSYTFCDVALGIRNQTTDQFELLHSKIEDDLNASTPVTSKWLRTGYKRDYGWTVYTTITPEPSQNPLVYSNDAINKNNKTIYFSRRITSIPGRNSIPRSEGFRSLNTTPQFTNDRLTIYQYSNELTHDIINTGNKNSQFAEEISLMDNSKVIPRSKKPPPLYATDILSSLSNSKLHNNEISKTNRSNQFTRSKFSMRNSSEISMWKDFRTPNSVSRYTTNTLEQHMNTKYVNDFTIVNNRTKPFIRRISPMSDTDAVPRSNSWTNNTISRYETNRLKPFTNSQKKIDDITNANHRNYQLNRRIPSIYTGSLFLKSGNSRVYDSTAPIVTEVKSKRESNIRGSSARRCRSSPTSGNRRCLKKLKKKKTRSRPRSSPYSKTNSTFLQVVDKIKRNNTDTTVSEIGLSRRKKLDEINYSFKQPQSYTEKGKDDSYHNVQDAASDIPCICHWNHQRCGCECEGSLNYDNFMNLSRLLRPCQNFTFTMRDGHFYALPPNLFTNINYVNIFHINISNSSFEYLLDPTPMTSAFTGVYFQHHAFVILDKVIVRREWNWSPFQKLQGAPGARVHVTVKDSLLKRLTSDFSNFANGQVESIDVAYSNLEMIGSAAFGTFVNMTNFRLPNNEISYLHRTDFPKVCSKLVEIDLRNNNLQNLEDGLFAVMPSLKEIKLAGNPLRMLSENTFQEIITRVNLRGISGFPLICDCHLKWLKDSKMANNDVIDRNMDGATCKRPGHLRGTPFNSLSKEHLIC